jgi:hypothetical protein
MAVIPATRAPNASGPSLGLGALLLAVALPTLQGCASCQSENNIIAKDPDDTDELQPEPEPVFENDWGQWLSMAAMRDGRPALAYYDATAGAAGFAIGTVKADGTVGWSHEEPDGYADDAGLDAGDRGKYTSLAVAANDEVWLSYRDNQNKTLRYARRDTAGVWTNGVADGCAGPTPDCGLFSSIALDASGNPVIAHYDAAAKHLRIARWNGSAFTASVADEGTPATPEGEANVGQFPRLRILNGVEYVSYYDVANGDLKLAVGTAGAWTPEIVDAEGDVGAWSDMQIVDGTVHLTYHDLGNEDLKYASGAPGGFTAEVVDNGQTVGADTALLISGSTIQILYHDGKNNDMRRAYRSADAWQNELITGDQGALGFHNEVLSTGGNNWAASYNYTDRTLWFSKLD